MGQVKSKGDADDEIMSQVEAKVQEWKVAFLFSSGNTFGMMCVFAMLCQYHGRFRV